MKRYPFALPTHRALDGIFELIEAHDLRAESVESINVDIGAAEEQALASRRTTSEFRALMSVPLALAAALIARQTTATEYAHAFYLRDDVQKLMQKVHITIRHDLAPEKDPNLGYTSEVTVTLTDGKALSSRVARVPRGNWSARLSAQEIWGKFRDGTHDSLSTETALRLFEQLQHIDKVASIDELAVC